MKFAERWLEWITSRERRKAERQGPPRLVAYYWDGGVPTAHQIRDISSTGFYLVTEQRWYPGTLVMISLQRAGVADTEPDRSIMVKAKVVRTGTDGVGLGLILPENDGNMGKQSFGANGADRKAFHKFLKLVDVNPGRADQIQSSQSKATQGQALIEYILMLPLIFLLIVNVVNFGGFFYAWITVANAARAGANYAILGGASVGSLSQASATQVTNVITQDISSLPNQASLAVNICETYNGTTTTVSGICSSIPADAEPINFELMSIDVTYTYVPFIPAGFQFPNLNIYATIPPTSIHRRAVMRLIQ